MPLKFERVDDSFQKGRLRIHYLDEFGQPRFFEFSPILEIADIRNFAEELVQQVNELLARPRPMKTEGVVYTNCPVRNQDTESSLGGFDGDPR